MQLSKLFWLMPWAWRIAVVLVSCGSVLAGVALWYGWDLVGTVALGACVVGLTIDAVVRR